MARRLPSAPSLTIEAPVAASMRRRLLAWYDGERRRLPWRETPTAYGTVVSEFMLQQTQVSTVVPYFERFVKQFPSFKALARAPEDEVLAAWSGLGYYRRARALKRAAEQVDREHGGALPGDRDALLDLPGFGPYTAAAVGSIALGLPIAAVDGNVRRVMSRIFALKGSTRDQSIEAIAQGLLDPARPGDWNQSVMELGATVCTPRGPRCLVCPLQVDCKARGEGRPEAYPAVKQRPAVRLVAEIAVAVIKAGKVLLLQRGEEGAFAGMWELPRLDTREVDAEELTPARVLFEVVRLRAKRFEEVGEARATFTHHRIRTRLVRATALDGAVRRQRHVAQVWVKFEDLNGPAASKAQRRLFELLQAEGKRKK
jgi:A/G-specific adenine glycosylase